MAYLKRRFINVGWMTFVRSTTNCVRMRPLGMKTPASLWHPSMRRYDPNPPAWQYPEGAEVRRLESTGQLLLNGRRWQVAGPLCQRTGATGATRSADPGVLLRYSHPRTRPGQGAERKRRRHNRLGKRKAFPTFPSCGWRRPIRLKKPISVKDVWRRFVKDVPELYNFSRAVSQSKYVGLYRLREKLWCRVPAPDFQSGEAGFQTRLKAGVTKFGALALVPGRLPSGRRLFPQPL